MKTKVFLATALFVIIGLSSCRQNENITDYVKDSTALNNVMKNYAKANDREIVVLANKISNIGADIDAVNLVHQHAIQSTEYGLDEVFYIKELASKNKKIVGKLAGNNIKDLDKKLSYNDIFSQISDQDYQIYWPYAENWDGKSLPAITFVSDDTKDEIVPAFLPVIKNGKMEMDVIMVDESYAEKKPVWIIRKSDLKYMDLPNFSEGEFVKNGVLFSTAANTINAAQENVYTMKLGRFMSSKHYDPWLKGGSEFMIYITETSVNTQLPGSPADLGATTQVNSIFVDRPRKTINKKQWVDVNAIGVSNWRPEVDKTTLVIMEKDWGGISGGTKVEIPYDIPIVGADGKTINVKGSITVLKEDDHVVTRVYDRKYIFSNLNFSNGQWTVYNNNNGVNWTLPTVIGQTIL